MNGTSAGAVALMGGGVLFLWSGYHGAALTGSLRDLLQGKQPSGSDTSPISGGTAPPGPAASTPAAPGSGSSDPHTALSQAAAAYGWNTGAQWQALSSLEMAEAGFDPHAKNPSSGAYGMAQSLGHPGTPGIEAAEYGGYGLTSAQQKAANSGDPYWQSVWMCAYIKAAYGDPLNAWGGYYTRGSWY